MIVEQLNGANLAFIGDAYYELCIRSHVIKKGITQQYALHDACVAFVSKTAQHQIAKQLYMDLFEEEKDIYHRGRNFSYKNKTEEYIHASGFEAVLGYLFLANNFSRLNDIIHRAIEIVEGT